MPNLDIDPSQVHLMENLRAFLSQQSGDSRFNSERKGGAVDANIGFCFALSLFRKAIKYAAKIADVYPEALEYMLAEKNMNTHRIQLYKQFEQFFSIHSNVISIEDFDAAKALRKVMLGEAKLNSLDEHLPALTQGSLQDIFKQFQALPKTQSITPGMILLDYRSLQKKLQASLGNTAVESEPKMDNKKNPHKP
jgi:hypothetical protein